MLLIMTQKNIHHLIRKEKNNYGQDPKGYLHMWGEKLQKSTPNEKDIIIPNSSLLNKVAEEKDAEMEEPEMEELVIENNTRNKMLLDDLLLEDSELAEGEMDESENVPIINEKEITKKISQSIKEIMVLQETIKVLFRKFKHKIKFHKDLLTDIKTCKYREVQNKDTFCHMCQKIITRSVKNTDVPRVLFT